MLEVVAGNIRVVLHLVSCMRSFLEKIVVFSTSHPRIARNQDRKQRSMAQPKPVIVHPDVADSNYIGFDKVQYLLSCEAHDIVLITVPPGSSPPLHHHDGQTETIYILSGKLRVKGGIDADEVEVEAGGLISSPPGADHTYINRTDQDVKMLVITTVCPSGGVVQFFREAGSAEPCAIDPAKAMPIGTTYGVTFSGPPLQ